jgi:DNA-binding transcriptional MocR family regulator
VTTSSDNPAALIAMDLATAIHKGLIGRGERLPTQGSLMKSYGVAMGTVAAALRKLRECGLAYSAAGRVFAAADDWPDPPEEYAAKLPRGEVALLFRASDICRGLAATAHPREGRAQFHDTAYDHEEGCEVVVRTVDASALDGLDRVMLRALGDALAAAARRFVGYGPAEIDRHLLTMAEVIVRSGARRDPAQPPIALMPGTPSREEDVALRIWPERAAALADGAPF